VAEVVGPAVAEQAEGEREPVVVLDLVEVAVVAGARATGEEEQAPQAPVVEEGSRGSG